MNKQIIQRNRIFLIIIFISMVSNTVPPILTSIQSYFSVSPALSSFLPFSSTLGSVITNFVGGFLIASFGIRASIKMSMIFEIMGSVLFFLFFNLFTVSLGALFLGVSLGGVFMTLTSSFAHLESNYQNYGLFHACYGFGGIIAPIIVYVFLYLKVEIRYIYLIYAALGFLILIFLSDKFEDIKYNRTNLSDTKNLLKTPAVLISFILFFLYSGSEVNFITWGGNLFKDSFKYSKETASIFLSVFWVFFTLTRVITDFLSKRFGYMKLLFFSSISAFLNILFMIVFKVPYLFILTAFLIAPFFPTLQKFMNRKVANKDVGLYSGLIYGFDSFGVMIFAPLMGLIVDCNSLYAYLVPLFSFLTIFLLLIKVAKTRSVIL